MEHGVNGARGPALFDFERLLFISAQSQWDELLINARLDRRGYWPKFGKQPDLGQYPGVGRAQLTRTFT